MVPSNETTMKVMLIRLKLIIKNQMVNQINIEEVVATKLKNY